MAVTSIEPSLFDAHVAFHLNAGVDVVITSAEDPGDEFREVMERYASEGYLVRSPGGTRDLQAVAHLAATEHSADWLISPLQTEFWWPRGTQIGDVLVAVPSRYGVVQALVREFAPRAGNEPFAERMVVRDSLAEASAGPAPLLDKLRSVWRLDRTTGLHGGQPLRAWYPFEVLSFALDAAPVSDADVAAGLESGSLVIDERLRDALGVLNEGSSYRLPSTGSPLTFPAPSIVDDALYAVECAAVGEVNLDRLDGQIRDLEARLAVLESGFWPRVHRFASRMVGGRRRHRG